jgi:hypothetical protein
MKAPYGMRSKRKWFYDPTDKTHLEVLLERIGLISGKMTGKGLLAFAGIFLGILVGISYGVIVLFKSFRKGYKDTTK